VLHKEPLHGNVARVCWQPDQATILGWPVSVLNGLYAADLSMCILLRGQKLGALLGRAGCTQPRSTLEEAGAAVVGCCHAGRVPLNGAALLSLAAPRDSLWLFVVHGFVCLFVCCIACVFLC
jgi:hypothetical protein